MIFADVVPPGAAVQDAAHGCFRSRRAAVARAGVMEAAAAAPACPPVRKREIFGWCCYDFANSAFITVVITVVFGPFFTGVVAAGNPAANTLWSTALSVPQLVVIVFGPVFGVMADATATKKRFLLGLMWVCAAATAGLSFTGPGTVFLAMALVIVAYAAFSFGENFCASFLSELSTPENVGRISGYGWGFGYFGGLGALGLALMILSAAPDRVPAVFLATAVFMVLSTIPVAVLLRERQVPRVVHTSFWRLAWEGIGTACRDLPKHRELLRFFAAFSLYMSGLGAVVAFAAIYSAEVLAFSTMENIALFASLQISSAAGALLCGWWQDKVGSVRALTLSLILWCAVAVGAYFCATKAAFFVVGNVAGLAIGSSQAASRAVVAQLSPPGRSAEFFGFWGVFGKFAAIAGPMVMGVTADVLGLRIAVLSTLVFFAGGLAVLQTVKMAKRNG